MKTLIPISEEALRMSKLCKMVSGVIPAKSSVDLAISSLPTQDHVVPTGITLTVVSASSSEECDVTVQDIKVGRYSQTANIARFYHRLLNQVVDLRFTDSMDHGVSVNLYNLNEEPVTAILSVIFGTKELCEAMPETAILGFDCNFATRFYGSLEDVVEDMVSGQTQLKDVVVRPGQQAVIAGRTQCGGRVREVLMLPDLIEGIGDGAAEIKVFARDVELAGKHMVEKADTRRQWTGELASDRHSYVLNRADLGICEEMMIEIKNHSFHRPISWLEFAAVLEIRGNKELV